MSLHHEQLSAHLRPAPLEIGQDTAEVLKSYGYTDAQIAEFAANGTTAPAPKPAAPAK